jgi:KipI family sensor histidine kinase inhibitor
MTERSGGRIAPLGDAALTVVLGDRVDPLLGERARRSADAVRAAAASGALAGVVDVVPAYASIVVHYDPLVVAHAEMAARVAAIVREAPSAMAAAPGRRHEIPVRYDGPDLEEVARRCGLETAEVVARHASVEYRVELVGFVPGFGYLAPLDPALVLPRRDRPRRTVPAGSVAIAGAQTGIYPLATPGGWHLIGRTDVVLFDPAREAPSLLHAGDRVRFVALDA